MDNDIVMAAGAAAWVLIGVVAYKREGIRDSLVAVAVCGLVGAWDQALKGGGWPEMVGGYLGWFAGGLLIMAVGKGIGRLRYRGRPTS